MGEGGSRGGALIDGVLLGGRGGGGGNHAADADAADLVDVDRRLEGQVKDVFGELEIGGVDEALDHRAVGVVGADADGHGAGAVAEGDGHPGREGGDDGRDDAHDLGVDPLRVLRAHQVQDLDVLAAASALADGETVVQVGDGQDA